MLLPGELLRAYAARAKKKFGQHFLTDVGLLDRIVSAGQVQADDQVLEIGPGCGTLTSRLLAAGADVTAVEIDRDAAAFLRATFAEERLTLVEADALETDLGTVMGAGRWRVVANLPYNVGTPILFALLECDASIESMALMFQREVAERVVAEPGSKVYGAMTLMVRMLADASITMRVKPGAFTPPPKVDSAVILVRPLSEPRVPDPGVRQCFRDAVTAGFAMRRKTLRNSLGARFGKDRAERALEAAGIDPRTRAERVDFAGFVRLAEGLASSEEQGAQH